WAAHQRGENVWSLWEGRLGTEEWHTTCTRLSVNGRTIAGNRQPLPPLNTLLQLYGGLRADFADLDPLVLSIPPQRSPQSVVKSGVSGMHQHVDAALEVSGESSAAEFGVAEVRYD